MVENPDANAAHRYGAGPADMCAAEDGKIDEINLKLTALSAALGMTDQVEAAARARSVAVRPSKAPAFLRSRIGDKPFVQLA